MSGCAVPEGRAEGSELRWLLCCWEATKGKEGREDRFPWLPQNTARGSRALIVNSVTASSLRGKPGNKDWGQRWANRHRWQGRILLFLLTEDQRHQQTMLQLNLPMGTYGHFRCPAGALPGLQVSVG